MQEPKALSSSSADTASSRSVTIAVRSSRLADLATVRVVDSTTVSIGSETVRGHCVVATPTLADVARQLVDAVFRQRAASSVTYLISGSDVGDELMRSVLSETALRLSRLSSSSAERSEFAARMFAVDNSTNSFACETLSADDLMLDARGAVPSLDDLCGISMATFALDQQRHASLICGARLTMPMIVALHLGVASSQSVWLSLGSDLTANSALQLLREYEAIAELVSLPTPQSTQPAERAMRELLDDEERDLLDEHIATLEAAVSQLQVQCDAAQADKRRADAEHTSALAAFRQQLQSMEGLLEEEQARRHGEHAQHERQHEMMSREAETARLMIDRLHKQIEQLSSSNRSLEARVLMHQRERQEDERERAAATGAISTLEQQLAELKSALDHARAKHRNESLQTAMEFQQKEKQWQNELADTYRMLQTASSRVEDLERTLQEQAHAIHAAAHAAELSHATHEHELDELVNKVKAISPLGRLPLHGMPPLNSSATYHHGGAADSTLGFKRDTSTASTYSPSRRLLGERSIVF